MRPPIGPILLLSWFQTPLAFQKPAFGSIRMFKLACATLLSGLVLTGGATGSAGDYHEIFRSGYDGRWVRVEYQNGRASANFHQKAKTTIIFSDVPIAGHVQTKWITHEIAAVDFPCGIGCSATYFASPNGTSGPFPGVLSVDARSATFAYVARKTIFVSAIGPPAKPLGQFPVPEFCARLNCDFHDSYINNVYIFSAGKHRVEIPLSPAGMSPRPDK